MSKEGSERFNFVVNLINKSGRRVMSEDGPSLLGSDQQEGYFNRESPPGLFDCAVRGHVGHDAEVFVEYKTYEGTEYLPTCAAGAMSVIKELRGNIGPHGVRWVNETPVMVASGKINGTLSSR